MAIRIFSCLFFLIASNSSFSQNKGSIVEKIPGVNITLTLVKIPAGSFEMGSAENAPIKEPDEMPAHKMQIEEFYMGKYEIDYMLFDAFTKDQEFSVNTKADAITRPTSPYIDLTAGMGKSEGYPANSMQQFNAIMFCRWLYKKTGNFYRLPSEAEWEYACRAGSTTAYPFGNDSASLKEYAWYNENSGGMYHKSGLLKPNAWGLYDMLGNVMEWTLDQYDENFYKVQADSSLPVRLPTAKNPRTVRGGSYMDDAIDTRSANRTRSNTIWNRRDPQIPKSIWWNADAPFVGMRVVRPVKQPTPEEAEAFFKRYLGK